MSFLSPVKKKYRDFKSAIMNSSICREIGYKEYCFNVASKFVGCNAKQCCYACVGLSELPLYSNRKNHAYLYVAVREGHVNCLSKIIEKTIKEICKTDRSLYEKEDIKNSYLQQIYILIYDMNIEYEKRQRMIGVLTFGFLCACLVGIQRSG